MVCRSGICQTGSRPLEDAAAAHHDGSDLDAELPSDAVRSDHGPAVDRGVADSAGSDGARIDGARSDNAVPDGRRPDAARSDAAVLCPPGSACEDDNPCTDDYCLPDGGCFRVDNTDGCDDHNPCTEQDVCSAGACRGAPAHEGDSCSDVDHCSGNTYYSGYSCHGGACTGDDVDIGCCAGSKCGPGEYCEATNHTCTPLPTCKAKVDDGCGYRNITGLGEGPNCTIVCMGCDDGQCIGITGYNKDSNGANRCDGAHRCCFQAACGEYTEDDITLISAGCGYSGTGHDYCVSQGYDWEQTTMWCVCEIYGIDRDYGDNCTQSCAYHRPGVACSYSPVTCGRYLCQ
ncbi:MAG: hypothetical protein JXR83_12150 [Deltaproteobacteria bacterium]|nr:hypothetical protein [Deltaproteobacteria bacterium]